MNKWLYIIALFFIQIQIVSCVDDELVERTDSDRTDLKLILNIPVDNAKSRGLIYGPDEEATASESTINDISTLVFNNNNQYIGTFQTTYSEGSLYAKIDIEEVGSGELTVLVLTNLEENGISPNNLEGKTKEQVIKSLQYAFSEKWDINKRSLPMWGETKITPVEGQTVNGDISLYRAVSKINVTVNKGKGIQREGKDVFIINSVRVYYARTSGLAGSLHAPVSNPEGSNTITKPSIPENVTYYPRRQGGFLYEATSGSNYTIENKIYVPESDQENAEEPMCLVVGGFYDGSTDETYYRVDFKQGNKGSVYYNAIRNHIYNFNITDVTRPGTDEPDPALDHVVIGMDVTIKDWTTEYMRGIGGQYTLDVSTGGFVLASSKSEDNILLVNTTYNESWSIENQSGSWFTLDKTSNGVVIKAKENNGGERRGTFIIKSGNLQKVITIHQRGKGTANSYIVSDKINEDGKHTQQELIVTVKGNGEVGLVADGHSLQETDPYISVNNIGDVKIIWETSDGLITIQQDGDKALLDEESGTIKYTVDLTKQNKDITTSNALNSQNYKGGNALIGAFGKNMDGSVNYDDLLWTWHIWVCPDLDTDNDGYVSDNELAANDEAWVTGYTFMDRNMGALSKLPGLPSLGLLYQWGRKDPFIGAAKVNTTQSGNQMYTHLPLQGEGYYWKNSSGNMSIAQTVKAPTTLINGIITDSDYEYLWGTASGLKGAANAGNKTIYDPCPYGYRVPNVAAVIFRGNAHDKIGQSNSEDNNWYTNNEFWPYKSDNYWNSDKDYITYNQVTGKNSYGFWLHYGSNDKAPDVKYYTGDANNSQAASTTKNSMTWLPLSGVYDGSVELADVSGQNSLLVNSIMWTNSSVEVGTTHRPAGLFLHGVQSSSSRDGNHFHKLKESGSSNSLYAKPEHAGALRCVRDVKINMGEEYAIKLPEEIKLDAVKGDKKEAELTSLLGSWEVIDPGAIWFNMTPDAGPAGSKQKITFESTQANTGAERSAFIKIRFNDGKGTIKSIKVTQAGKKSELVVSTNSMSFTKQGGTQTFTITSDTDWEITANRAWITVNPENGNGNKSISVTCNKNTWGRSRYATLTITTKDGSVTEQISVNQTNSKD